MSKMMQYTVENARIPDTGIDLKDETAVTEQCLHICTNARSDIESLSNRESSLLQEDLPECLQCADFDASGSE